MRLHSFHIQNFRSIIDTGDVKISELDNITILAGQNESGKTSVLEALDFLEHGVGPDFEDQQRRLGTHPKVECKYLFSDADIKSINTKIGNKKIGDILGKSGCTFGRGEIDKDYYESLVFLYDPELKALCDETKLQNESGEEEIYGLDRLAKLIRSLRPEMIFYSSFEDSILPGKIRANELDSNQAIKDFEIVYSVNFRELLNDPSDRSRDQKLEELNNKASENLNEYWKQTIDEESQYKYKISGNPQSAQPEESYITIYVDRGDNHPLSISQKSTGFRWFASFNLRLRAHQASYSEPGKFILLIDEPGQGLHEEAQKNVMRVINEMGDDGWQILYSTHLPQLLGGEKLDFSRIKLVMNSIDNGTKIKNVAQASTDYGFKDAFSPLRTAIGQVSLGIEEFLGDKKTVIVEGITDYYYLKAWAQLLKKDKKFNFVPPVGVTQIPNVYAILLGWGVPSLIIVDGDTAGTTEFNRLKKAYFENSDAQTRQTVYVNTGCRGIEDTFSSADFNSFAGSILSQVVLSSAEENSKKAKSKKELLARTFFDKTKDGSTKLSNLSDNTKNKVKAIFEFLEQ